jgi:hypothetical protein
VKLDWKLVVVQHCSRNSQHLQVMANILPNIYATPWSRDRFEKLIVAQIVKKFCVLYRTRRFITAFTKARHWSISWAIRMASAHNKWDSWDGHFNIILPFMHWPVSNVLQSAFRTELLYAILMCPIHATWPSHHSLPDFDRPNGTVQYTW